MRSRIATSHEFTKYFAIRQAIVKLLEALCARVSLDAGIIVAPLDTFTVTTRKQCKQNPKALRLATVRPLHGNLAMPRSEAIEPQSPDAKVDVAVLFRQPHTTPF